MQVPALSQADIASMLKNIKLPPSLALQLNPPASTAKLVPSSPAQKTNSSVQQQPKKKVSTKTKQTKSMLDSDAEIVDLTTTTNPSSTTTILYN